MSVVEHALSHCSHARQSAFAEQVASGPQHSICTHALQIGSLYVMTPQAAPSVMPPVPTPPPVDVMPHMMPASQSGKSGGMSCFAGEQAPARTNAKALEAKNEDNADRIIAARQCDPSPA